MGLAELCLEFKGKSVYEDSCSHTVVKSVQVCNLPIQLATKLGDTLQPAGQSDQYNQWDMPA